MYSDAGVSSSGFGIFSIVWLVVMIAVIVGFWKMLVKAGKPGWGALIPFYNLYLLLKIAGYSGWFLLLFFVPIANVIMAVLTMLGVAKAFGRGVLFAIFGLILFSPIGIMILGYGNDAYQKK